MSVKSRRGQNYADNKKKIKVKMQRYNFHCDRQLENEAVTSHGHKVSQPFFFFNVLGQNVTLRTLLTENSR